MGCREGRRSLSRGEKEGCREGRRRLSRGEKVGCREGSVSGIFTWSVVFSLQVCREEVSGRGPVVLPLVQPAAAGEAELLPQRRSVDLHPVQEPARRSPCVHMTQHHSSGWLERVYVCTCVRVYNLVVLFHIHTYIHKYSMYVCEYWFCVSVVCMCGVTVYLRVCVCKCVSSVQM